jgi:hypothetical protein
MTLLYVALGLVIAVALYYTYRYVTGGTSRQLPMETVYLKEQAAAPQPISAYSTPSSLRCNYGLWLFLNNLDARTTNNNGVTTVFTLKDSRTEPYGVLELDAQSTLRFVINKGMTSTEESFELSKDFPLQKWTRLDLSFDNRRFDYFQDGGLLRSFQMAKTLSLPDTATIAFARIDAYLNGFERPAAPADPDTAREKYFRGQKALSGAALPKYGISVQLVKDNVAQKTFSLF